MLHFQIKHFSELSKDELYTILQQRSEVFVVGQQCIYQDLDNRDKTAQHALLYMDKKLCAYARILCNSACIHFGRVLTVPEYRGKGYAKQLMEALMAYLRKTWPGQRLEIDAQSYLISFYEAYGLETMGEDFILEQIPHRKMWTLL